MPRARSRTVSRKTKKIRALPKEAVSLTDWNCWPLAASDEKVVSRAGETTFWRKQTSFQLQKPAVAYGQNRVSTVSTAPIAQAMFLCKAQGKFLDKAREALQRMQELAILVQQSPAEGRANCLEEFDTLVSFLEKLADTEIDGLKLFHTANEILSLEGDNRLIMAGIDLNSENFRGVLRARIGTPEDASQAQALLQKGLRFITINREILSSNIGRLFFARERLDEVKESLQAA